MASHQSLSWLATVISWDNGVMLRLALTPLWAPPVLDYETERVFYLWAGLGIGYTF